MTLMARYSTVCGNCDSLIHAGDLMRHDGTDWTHVHCPDPLPEITRKVCGRCFQEVAANGACGCDD